MLLAILCKCISTFTDKTTSSKINDNYVICFNNMNNQTGGRKLTVLFIENGGST